MELNHPNIIRVVDFNIDMAPYYYVMEYCERGSLEKIGGSNFKGDIAKSAALLEPICDALAAARAKGIVHRDLKPANILMRADGTPAIADFGICHVDGEKYVTLHEEAMGALNYIAPEMESGRHHLGEPSERTDVYALGKVFYWMLSRGSIFAREDHRATPLTKVLGEQRWEHAHMLLDKVIVEKPSDRFDLKTFLRELRKERELVMGNFAPLKPSIGIQCRFCGLGTYRRVGERVTDNVARLMHNYHSGDATVISVKALSCSNCGHVEFFQFERTGSWWTQ
jgi:serine/threonine protein kinase